MLKLARNLTLSAILGLGALGAIPASASADSLAIKAGSGGIAIEVGHGRHWHGRPGWHGPRYRACTPRQAVTKASRMGVRHARVHHASHRSVTVSGRKHGHRVRVVFARVPGCPVIC